MESAISGRPPSYPRTFPEVTWLRAPEGDLSDQGILGRRYLPCSLFHVKSVKLLPWAKQTGWHPRKAATKFKVISLLPKVTLQHELFYLLTAVVCVNSVCTPLASQNMGLLFPIQLRWGPVLISFCNRVSVHMPTRSILVMPRKMWHCVLRNCFICRSISLSFSMVKD